MNKNKKGIILGYFFFAAVAIILFFLFKQDGLDDKVKNLDENLHEIELENTLAEIETNETLQEITTFIIKKGEGLDEISQNLKDHGLIKNEILFKIYAVLNQAKNKFWPGEYQISLNKNIKGILSSLISRPLAPEKQVVIVEGLSNRQIEKFLIQQGLILEGDFVAALKIISQNQVYLNNFSFLDEKSKKISNDEEIAFLQGYLFPDTYRFYEQTSAEAIIKKMLENFETKYDSEIKEKIKDFKYSITDVLTMASIIEKEAALDQDRRLVADIFWKRLESNWALESCATINYILGEPKERLSYDETRIPSPYNTYLNPGLPPRAINNPGLSSIRVAISPLKNDYCCFLSTPEGQIIFSRSIEEHNQNKSIYLK